MKLATRIRTWVRLKIDELRALIDPFDDWPNWPGSPW